MTNNRDRQRQLRPIQDDLPTPPRPAGDDVEATESFTAAIARAEQLRASIGRGEVPDGPPGDGEVVAESERAYSWPGLESAPLEATAVPDLAMVAVATVHANVYADIYAALCLHNNGLDDDDAALWAIEAAQKAADLAAVNYAPAPFEDAEPTELPESGDGDR